MPSYLSSIKTNCIIAIAASLIDCKPSLPPQDSYGITETYWECNREHTDCRLITRDLGNGTQSAQPVR